MAPLGRAHRSVRRGGSAFDPLRVRLTLRRETGELGLSQPLQRRTLSAVPLGEHDRPGQTGGYSHQFPIRLPQPRRPVPGQRGHLAHLPHPHRRHAAQRHGGGAPHRPESRRRPLHGRVDIYFFPDQTQARRPVRTAASRGTLWLLTLFQVLMFLQFLPGLTAGASLPVCIGFGGLVLLSWVFCSLRRTGSRGLEVLALLLTTVASPSPPLMTPTPYINSWSLWCWAWGCIC